MIQYNSQSKGMSIKFNEKMQISPKGGRVPPPEIVQSKNEKRQPAVVSSSQNQMFRTNPAQQMGQIPMNSTQ